jgi:hypothetical protein
VIVSAQRGQYFKPGSLEPGFFLRRAFTEARFSSHERIRRSFGDSPFPLTAVELHRIIIK